MSAYWKGKLIIWRDERGQFFASDALPQGSIIGAESAWFYEASGPWMPSGFPGPVRIAEPSAWLDKLLDDGFMIRDTTGA
jgi:hypothetical protein